MQKRQKRGKHLKGQDMLFINIKLKFETGTSDFHQLIITIFKVKPDKLPPRIINIGIIKILKGKHLITNFR